MDQLPHISCFLGAAAHVFLIAAFIKDPLKCFKNSGTYLVENLAVTDFFVNLLSPLDYCCLIPRHPPWLRLRDFVLTSGTNVSILTIALISLDRFFMVVYPLKYRVLMRKKIIVMWLACIWLLCSAYPAKVFLITGESDNDKHIFTLGETFPILFSSVMCVLTYHKLKKQSENLALENIPKRQQQARLMKEKQFLKTIIIIACIQFFCIVPTSIVSYYPVFKIFIDDDLAVLILSEIFHGLFHLNFAVNPLVYVLRLPNYRRTFYLLYCCQAKRH